MRYFVVSIIIALIAGAATLQSETADYVPEGFIEDLINKTIEGLRPNIPDPLTIDHLDIVLPGAGLDGSFNISNLKLTGLKGFQLTYLKYSLLSFQLNFTLGFPTINVNSDYKADAVFGKLIPVYGGGNANVHINNIEIHGTGKANLTGGLSVSNIRIQLQVESAVFDIHGVINNEDFSKVVSSVLTDIVANFINDHQKLISDIISPIAQAIINVILGGGNHTITDSANPPMHPEMDNNNYYYFC